MLEASEAYNIAIMAWPRGARLRYTLGLSVLLWVVVSISGDVQCECGESEFVEFHCVTSRGNERNAVCRSCEDFCGVGGACRGGGRSDCRSCGPLRSRDVLVNTFLEDEGPVTERGWSHCTDDDDGNDTDCHLIGDGHGVCRRCSECLGREFMVSACDSLRDTVCQDKVMLPNVMIISEGESLESKQVTLRLSQRQLRATDVPSRFHEEYYIAYMTADPNSGSRLLRLPTCSDATPSQQLRQHVLDISATTDIAAIACPLENDNRPWLPSGVSEQLVAVRPVCECESDEWTVDSCDEATGRAVQCRKCDDSCGKGGTCVGPNADDCTSCGVQQTRGAEMFFTPSLSGGGDRGECRECGEACGEGFFMTSPCSESSPVECQPCSACEDGEYAFIECDGRSNQDTVCVGGKRLERPHLEPEGPILLPEGAQKVSLQLSAPDGAYLLYTIWPDMEERLQSACFSSVLQQQYEHKLRSTAGSERDSPHSITMTFAPGSTSLMAVACPIDSDGRSRPPSEVMAADVVVMSPFTQPVSGTEAAVTGGVEITGDSDRLSSAADASRRFRSLLRFALLNSEISDAIVFVAEKSIRTAAANSAESVSLDAHQPPRRSMLQVAHAAAFPPAKHGAAQSSLTLRYEIHTSASDAVRIREAVAAQLEPDGGVSLGMAVEGLRLRTLAEASAVCSLAETRPCEMAPGRFGDCRVEEDPRSAAMCLQRAPAILLSPGGSCATPCGPLEDFLSECRPCACEEEGCDEEEISVTDEAVDNKNKGVSPGWIVFGVWICLAVVVLLAWLYITKYKQSELQLAHITSHLDKVVTGIGQILTRAAKQPSEPTSEETSLRLAEVKDSHDVVFQSFNPAYSASSAGSSASAQRLTEEEQVDINNIADPEQRVQMVEFLNAMAGVPRKPEPLGTASVSIVDQSDHKAVSTAKPSRIPTKTTAPVGTSTRSPTLPSLIRAPSPSKLRSGARPAPAGNGGNSVASSVWDNAATEITSAREVRRSITNEYEPAKGGT